MKKKIIVNNNGLLEINLKNLEHNYKILKKTSSSTTVAAVLKSDCYGLGSERILKKLIELGCDHFFLTSLEESIFIRQKTKNTKVILLNGVINLTKRDFYKILNFKIIPVINSFDELKKFNSFLKKTNSSHPLIFHFDTGINRLGISEHDQRKIFDYCKINKFEIYLIMSHLASADEPNSQLNRIQQERFNKISKSFKNFRLSLANSHAAINFKYSMYDITRSGGALFGTIKNKNLKNIINFKSRILQIKEINSNHEFFGYNATFQSKQKRRIAILGCGYADGYPRILSNRSFAFFKKKLPILGSISMDYMTVEITDLKKSEINVGDFVELIGENISINEIAEKSNTIPYEILNNIGFRAKKIYID